MMILVILGAFLFVLCLLPFWRYYRARPVFFPFTLFIKHKYPAFENPADYPWVALLENNASAMRDELMAFVDEHQVNGINSPFVYQSAPNIWKVIPLTKKDNPGQFSPSAQKNFRTTVDVLQQVPHIFSAYFSYMEPNSQITPHRGEADGYIRGHLALKIPASLPICGFQVRNEKRSWEEGKVLLFNDLHRHTAFNYSDEGRFIIMFDVMRPRYIPVKKQYMTHKYEIFDWVFEYTSVPWHLKIPARFKQITLLMKAMIS